MKTKLYAFASMFIGLAAHLVMGGAVDNRTNFSAEYIRTVSRNAATNSADAAIYNPAGVMKLEDGLYVNANNQTLIKFNRQIAPNQPSYKSDLTSFILPTGFIVFKHDDWSIFSTLTFPIGGGNLDYQEGTVSTGLLRSALLARDPDYTTDVKLAITSIAPSLGGAYAINKMYSIAASLKYVYAQTTIEVDAGKPLSNGATKAIDHKESASGWGGAFGINITPSEALTIGLRFETIVKMEYEVDKSDLNFETELASNPNRVPYLGLLRQSLKTKGSKFNHDIPPEIGLGLGYQFNPIWRTDLSFNYFMNKISDWGGAEDKHNDGWESGLALEAQVHPQWALSTGILYYSTGAKPESYSPENPGLNGCTVASGFAYHPTAKVNINFGFGNGFYFEDKTTIPNIGDVTLRKNTFILALGLQYKIL